MKKKELQEYKSKVLAELEKELLSLREKMTSLKLDVVTGKVKSLKEFKHTKKSIAQVNTMIQEAKAKQQSK